MPSRRRWRGARDGSSGGASQKQRRPLHEARSLLVLLAAGAAAGAAATCLEGAVHGSEGSRARKRTDSSRRRCRPQIRHGNRMAPTGPDAPPPDPAEPLWAQRSRRIWGWAAGPNRLQTGVIVGIGCWKMIREKGAQRGRQWDDRLDCATEGGQIGVEAAAIRTIPPLEGAVERAELPVQGGRRGGLFSWSWSLDAPFGGGQRAS